MRDPFEKPPENQPPHRIIEIPISAFPTDRLRKIEAGQWDALEPNSERAKEIDQQLEFLGTFFAGTAIEWRVKGSLNLSLRSGQYYRDHKDIDISLLASDIPTLGKRCTEMNVGIYSIDRATNSPQAALVRGSARFEEIHADQLEDFSRKGSVIFVRKDESGDPLIPIEFIDIHISHVDAEKHRVIDGDFQFPVEWYQESETKLERNGVQLPLDPLPVFVCQKLLFATMRKNVYGDTNYDWRDLEMVKEFLAKNRPGQTAIIREQVVALFRGQIIQRSSEQRRSIVEAAIQKFEDLFTSEEAT